jgi:hypothetical protein
VTRAKSIVTAGVIAVCAMSAPSQAFGVGGRYAFEGGTPAQQRQVTRALAVSDFDWDVVPKVVIHIASSADSYASPGHIWLDGNLLAAGAFAWGVVQHEFAHQVDFLLLSDADRDILLEALGGKAWCSSDPRFRHGELGCERFASTLAWSYWPSPENCMKPESPGDESAALPPSQFRALLAEVLRRHTSLSKAKGRR